MGAWTFALRSRRLMLNCRPQSRRFSSAEASLHEIVVEEPSSWRLFPAKGEVFEEQVEVGPHVVRFECGKLARFASGAVVLCIKDTQVLTTVVGSASQEENKGFLPLQVDYREKYYAQGKIPNTFMRREGAPKERELLVSRLVDRSIRPLFPKGYCYESQVMSNVLCSDGQQDPDILAACGASTALMISDIPWDGPVGVVRIGRVDGKFMINPTMDDLALSDLNLVYACTIDKTIMMETQAREITENDLKDALKLAHKEATKLIAPQIQLALKVQNQKRSFVTATVNTEVLEKVRAKAEVAINTVMGNSSYGKFERGKALSNIQADVQAAFEKEGEEKCLKALPLAFDQVRKEVVKKNIFEKGQRVDGRRLDEVRDLNLEIDCYTPLHGSSLFSRGNTQVLCTVTLGTLEQSQTLDSLVGPPKKRFMLHYSFPPYCINEIWRPMGPNRREVGHGNLAEKALVALLPREEEFPYSVRVTSEVMASDGSSSMATVCGGSLALMDAGVPLRSHVAGVSVGLIREVDEDTGKVLDYRILTDILGLEDHVGDMDFKIAGTRVGITAIQLDIKPNGIPLDILCEALEPARIARMHILDAMESKIAEPRAEQKPSAPHKGHFSIQREFVSRLIGPHGSTVRSIERATAVRIDVSEEGLVSLIAKDKFSYDQAKSMVDSILGKEIEVGNIYSGCVVHVKDFGAFLRFEGGHLGLLHISELSHEKVTNVAEVVTVGQKLDVKCIGRDGKGNLKLSLKAITLPPTTERNEESTIELEELQQVITPTSTAPTSTAIDIEVTETKQEVLVFESLADHVEGAGEAKRCVAVELEKVHISEGNIMDIQETCKASKRVEVHMTEGDGEVKIKSTLKKSKPGSVKKSQLSIDEEHEVMEVKSKSSKLVAENHLKVNVSQDNGVKNEQGQEVLKKAVLMPKPHENMKAKSTFEKERSALCKESQLGIDAQHEAVEARSNSKKADSCSSRTPQSCADVEYEVTVHQVRALGLVVKLHNGELGKLFFDEETTDLNICSGDLLRVRCIRKDRRGIPVFTFVRLLSK